MKNVKKFENFSSNSFNAISTIGDLTNYYLCDDCGALGKSQLNEPKENRCRFCGKKNITTLDSDEWFDKVGERIDPDEIELNEKDREKSRTIVDLISLGKYIDNARKGFKTN